MWKRCKERKRLAAHGYTIEEATWNSADVKTTVNRLLPLLPPNPPQLLPPQLPRKPPTLPKVPFPETSLELAPRVETEVVDTLREVDHETSSEVVRIKDQETLVQMPLLEPLKVLRDQVVSRESEFVSVAFFVWPGSSGRVEGSCAGKDQDTFRITCASFR